MAAKRHYASEHYAGHSERRRQESEDSSMIHEDHNAVANMPQNVIMRPYRMDRDWETPLVTAC